VLRLWSVVRADLDKVIAPILLFRSEQDHVVGPKSARIIQAGVSSDVLTKRVLTRSFHVATLDYEAEEIFAGSLAFIEEHVGRATARHTAGSVERSA
jgi:carboxylesterase